MKLSQLIRQAQEAFDDLGDMEIFASTQDGAGDSTDEWDVDDTEAFRCASGGKELLFNIILKS